MSASTASAFPRRDRWIILAGLLGVAGLCWLYLIDLSIGMAPMSAGGTMELQPWSARDFALMFLMWVAMMVGMMVPTATPMALIYAAVARKALRQGSSIAPTFVFVGGYIAMWALFSIAATLAQWALESTALLSPGLASASPLFGAALLIGAGAYQLSPAKDACLEHCRAPAMFFAEHWRPGTAGAFRMGLVHGAFCLGCCWILMGLLFFGGVMNLLWIAGLTLFVLLEKLAPVGPWLGRTAGVAWIGAGLVVLFAPG